MCFTCFCIMFLWKFAFLIILFFNYCFDTHIEPFKHLLIFFNHSLVINSCLVNQKAELPGVYKAILSSQKKYWILDLRKERKNDSLESSTRNEQGFGTIVIIYMYILCIYIYICWYIKLKWEVVNCQLSSDSLGNDHM